MKTVQEKTQVSFQEKTIVMEIIAATLEKTQASIQEKTAAMLETIAHAPTEETI